MDKLLKEEKWYVSQEMLADFLEKKRGEGWSDEKYRKFSYRLSVFYADLSEEKEISREILEKWRRHLEEKGLSRRTVAEYITAVNELLREMKREDLCFRQGSPLKLEGRRFGNLTALYPVDTRRAGERSILWKCQCQCGTLIEVPARELTRGTYKSCGCQRIERLQESNQYVNGTCLKMVFSDAIRTDNTSGCKGVFRKRDKWSARIQYQGKIYSLGTYLRKEDAIRARKEAEAKVREEARELISV